MGAILGIFGEVGADEGTARRMLAAMRPLGHLTALSSPAPGVWLGAARHEWELVDDLAGPCRVVEEGGLHAVADASLYYRRDLGDRLAAKGRPSTAAASDELTLAALRAWGERAPERLEGDYAFISYDAREGRVLCARDLAGKRPLFYAELGRTLLVASSVGGILAHPRCRRGLSLPVIGSTAAYRIWSLGAESCYEAVRVVPMAGVLTWPGPRRTSRHWCPGRSAPGPPRRFDAAAAELRELLAQAVAERMASAGPTAVYMSGGWDSTALFAAGRYATGPDDPGRLRPVSISYPEGDLGREDELIAAVADAWAADVRWLDIGDIPLFDRDEARAADRDEPAASPYEGWVGALTDAARGLGARVALEGNGGDQLFSGTDVYLSDLLRSGRWLKLAREIRTKRALGRRYVFEMTVVPRLPSALAGPAARRLGGGRAGHYLERPWPDWVRADFLSAHDMIERERACLPPPGPSLADAELRWGIRLPMLGYLHGLFQPRFLRAGVHVRTPLLDRRVVDFALARPPEERVGGGESKRLLRAAMRGLLPEAVLAPRKTRTGVTLSYSRRSMKEGFPERFDRLFRSDLVLAQLGIVDPGALRTAVQLYLDGRGERLRMDLYHTLQTELWLRAHAG